MTEGLKDKLIGGAIALVVAIIVMLITNWWNTPGSQDGVILVNRYEFNEVTRSIGKDTGKLVSTQEMFAVEYKFNNIKSDLKDFSILIPLNVQANDAIYVESEPSDAIVKAVSSPSQIRELGKLRIDVSSMERGDEIIIRIKSPVKIYSSTINVAKSDIKDIIISPPSTLHLYL